MPGILHPRTRRLKTTIYYFTGTGNSLKIAKDLAASIEGAELIPIAAHWQAQTVASHAERVGFVHPLYWYGLPGLVRAFVKRIDLESAGYVFAVATCQIPGGICLKQMASLLDKKGKNLAAGFYVQMPNNYILGEYTVTPEAERQELFLRAAEKVKQVARTAAANARHRDGNPVSDALFRLSKQAQDKYSAWVKTAVDRDSHYVVQDSCNGCGICAMVCPVGNIQMQDDLPQWQHRCEGCLACTHHCPRCAIQYGEQTVGKERYRHPDITLGEIIAQKRTAE
jgi:ferredoxin